MNEATGMRRKWQRWRLRRHLKAHAQEWDAQALLDKSLLKAYARSLEYWLEERLGCVFVVTVCRAPQGAVSLTIHSSGRYPLTALVVSRGNTGQRVSSK